MEGRPGKSADQAGDKYCNSDDLSKRPNDVSYSLPDEKEAFRGPLPEFNKFDSAILEAKRRILVQCELNYVQNEKLKRRQNEFEDANFVSTERGSTLKRNFFESSESLVVYIAADVVGTTPMKVFLKPKMLKSAEKNLHAKLREKLR